MKKIILGYVALLAALLPCVSSADVQPAKKVLIWGPTNPGGRNDFTIISTNGLRRAYEELIPSASYYAHKYPNGIKLDSFTSTGQPAVDLPVSLDEYALVFVMFPHWDITSNQVTKLKTVTARGGRLVLIGEHSNWAPVENGVLTRLAMAMGTHFSIGNGAASAADQFNPDADLLLDPLSTMPKSHHVAPIVYSGIAQEIARLKTSPNYVWAVDEVSGNGRITVFSDINWCLAETYSNPLETTAIPFLERLLSNAIECEQKVIDGDDPNQGIEEKIPAGMVAAVRDQNGFLSYYSTVVEACAVAKVKTDCTVVLKREVAESFELPVGVTFDTSEVTTNYAGTVSAPYGYEVRINAAHTIYKVEAVPSPNAPIVSATDGTYPDRVVVTWREPDSPLPITAYEVKRVKVGSTLEVVLTNSLTGLTYVDFDMKEGVKYTYYVRAKSDAGWGWYGDDVGWTGQGGAVSIPLPVAVDVEAPNGVKVYDLTLSTSVSDGGNVWYGQDDETHDSIDAGRSGYTPDGGTNIMSTVVTNAGTISFWWNVSSEPLVDTLSFSVDGVVKARIGGISRSWEQKTFEIGAGRHVLEWSYCKDAKNYMGQDAGWVDQIVWKPLAVPGAPGVVNASDGTLTNGVDVTWTPSMSGGAADSYELSRSEKGSDNWTVLASGFKGTAWTDTTALPGVEYTYRVRGGNAAGNGPYESDNGWSSIALYVDPAVIEIGFASSTTNIAVSATTNWTAVSGANWLSSAKLNDSYASVTVSANDSLLARTNTVTVTAGSGVHATNAVVTVIQAGRPPLLDVGFASPYDDWRTRMQVSTNTTPDTYYAPVSVFIACTPLDISFGWTNKSEVAVSMPSVRFRIFKSGNPARICVSDWTATGRPSETAYALEGKWSGHWTCDVLKVLKPGDYLLEAEMAPAGSFDDADRSDNTAVFRFAVRDVALDARKDIFTEEDGWMNVVQSPGNDFAQPPHVAIRKGSAGTNETAVQFGPYVPMDGVNGRITSVKKPLDLVFLIDYTGSMSGCIAGLVNNIGIFIDQLFLGDPAKGIDPISDLRVKIVGFNDTRNYSYRDWFWEGNFTSDRTELKKDLAYLRSKCGYGSGNGGESSYDALYYLCKGWTPTKPSQVSSPPKDTSAEKQFRGTNVASRAVIMFTDEPPLMPFNQSYYKTLASDSSANDESYCMNLLSTALIEANINLTIVNDGYCYKNSSPYKENYPRFANLVNRDRTMRELIEFGGYHGALAAFAGDADLLRGLATNVSSKVAVDAKVVEPMFSAAMRGGGTLTFDWKNDSVAGTNNTFSFLCDGATNITRTTAFGSTSFSCAGSTNLAKAAGADWETLALSFGEGVHNFKWSYGKLGGYTNGVVTDCGVVSNVRWLPWTNSLSVFHVSEIPVVATQECAEVDWYGTPVDLLEGADTNVVFTVECNTIWKVVEHSDWITVVQGNGNGDGELVVSVATNTTYADRLGYITVRAGEYGLPSDLRLGTPERKVFISQEANPYNEDGTVRVLTVDVKPRWPWSTKVDIDFRVQTPAKEGTPVTVKVWGLNKEGGSMVNDYPTLALLKECAAKTGIEVGFGNTNYSPVAITEYTTYDTNVGFSDNQVGGIDLDDDMVYIYCPTSGYYRFTWDMGEDWRKTSYQAWQDTSWDSNWDVWRDSNMFHTPEFAVRLKATNELLGASSEKESGTVRVDMRLSSLYAIEHEGDETEDVNDVSTWAPAGGKVLVGVERIGHPYGAVDPILVDTRTQFPIDGWNCLDGIPGLPVPPEYSNISNRACVINSDRVAIEGGMITTNTVWGVDKVHVIRDNVFVAPDVTLTIEANAIVKFCDCTRIYVHEYDSIQETGGYHNIVVKGAVLVHGYSHVGGDTLRHQEHDDTSLPYGGDLVIAQGEIHENDVASYYDWMLEAGKHPAMFRLELSYVWHDPSDLNHEVFAECNTLGLARFYSYGQKLGNLQRPSKADCRFYGWYYYRPDYTALGYYLENPDGYEESKRYFIGPDDIPFSLDENAGEISDTLSGSSTPEIYALFCAQNWSPDGPAREDASAGYLILSADTAVYNGSDQTPQVKEVWVGGLMITNSNFDAVYSASPCVHAGTYTVSVDFTYDYFNSPTATFTIMPRSTEGGSIVFSPTSKMYERGEVSKPDVTVSLPGMAVPDEDCTVRWIDADGRWPRPGKYKVTASFNGNYTGPSLTNEFTVTMNPEYVYREYTSETAACDAIAANPSTKDGTAARRILYIGGRENDALTEYVKDLFENDIDFCDYVSENFICWADDIDDPGSKYAYYSKGLASDVPPILAIVSANDTTRALSSHAGYITREDLWAFLQNAKTLPEDASSATLNLSDERLPYIGDEQKPSVEVIYANAKIDAANYDLVWSGDCTEVGTYTVKAVFNAGGFIGETESFMFQIIPAPLDISAVTLDPESATFDGETHWPDVAVSGGATYGVEYLGGDFTVAGSYTVRVTASGNYSGTVNLPFTIAPKEVAAIIELDSEKVEITTNKPPASPIMPMVIAVRDSSRRGRTYVDGVDYDIDFGDPANYMVPGTNTITATFKGNYTGIAAVEFIIEVTEMPHAINPAVPGVGVEVKAPDAETAVRLVSISVPADAVSSGVAQAVYESYFDKKAIYDDKSGSWIVTAELNPKVVLPESEMKELCETVMSGVLPEGSGTATIPARDGLYYRLEWSASPGGSYGGDGWTLASGGSVTLGKPLGSKDAPAAFFKVVVTPAP